MKAPKIHSTLDDSEAIKILKLTMPSWIEEMPMLASVPRTDGKASIVTAEAYNENVRSGIIAFYYGHNCNPNDRGWMLSFVYGVGEDLFRKYCSELKAKALNQSNKVSS